MNPSPAAPVTEPSPAPLHQRAPATVYEMRTPGADAARDEAIALAQDHLRWLSMRGLPVPARADIPALFGDPQAESAGLFEDGLLLPCMIPQPAPDLEWGQGPCRFLGCIHTLPDRHDDTVQPITRWASGLLGRAKGIRRAVTDHRRPGDGASPVRPGSPGRQCPDRRRVRGGRMSQRGPPTPPIRLPHRSPLPIRTVDV